MNIAIFKIKVGSYNKLPIDDCMSTSIVEIQAILRVDSHTTFDAIKLRWCTEINVIQFVITHTTGIIWINILNETRVIQWLIYKLLIYELPATMSSYHSIALRQQHRHILVQLFQLSPPHLVILRVSPRLHLFAIHHGVHCVVQSPTNMKH
jgi:hypothetical protein